MDFSSRRDAAIMAAKKKLREPLPPDKIIIYSYRYNNDMPCALEHWLFAVMPCTHPSEAKDLIARLGRDAWKTDGRGSDMCSLGWDMLISACKGEKVVIDELCEREVPNLSALLGVEQAARFIDAAGGLDKLSRMTQRDCLKLGNESGTFGGRRKKGLIECHELATTDKAVRILCSRTVLAARLDFYKGMFKGDSLRQEVLYAQ